MEADQVRAKARQEGNTVHFGRICKLCHERGSELENGDPYKKVNGRAVLLADNVGGQDFNWAGFCELGSSPPSTEAAKALDAMCSLPGCLVKTGDARGPTRNHFCVAPKRGLRCPNICGRSTG